VGCTGLKCVAIRNFLIGSISASLTAIAISLPEYPSVISPNCRNSLCVKLFGVSPIFNSNIFVLAWTSGRGIKIRRSKRRRMAASSCQGIFVAPRTRTPLGSLPTPFKGQQLGHKTRNWSGRARGYLSGFGTFIWTRNSVLTLLDASLSPSPLVPHIASTSSIKIIEGLFCLAIVNSCFTNLPSIVPQNAAFSTSHSHPSIYLSNHLN